MTVPHFKGDDHERHYNELVDAVNAGAATGVASSVTFTPGGTVASNNVQDAILEVAAEAGSGGLLNVVSKTSNYTITDADDLVLADNTSGSVAITLPTAVGRTGRRFTVTKKNAVNGSASCEIKGTGSETISGMTRRGLYGRGESITAVSDGTNWQIADGNVPQIGNPSEVYVNQTGTYVSGDGYSPQTAFRTFAEAIAAVGSSASIYICGSITEDIVVDKNIRIVGLGQRAALIGATNTVDSATVRVTASLNVQMENLTIQLGGGTSAKGVGLLLDGASQGSYRQLNIGAAAGTTPTAYPTSVGAGTGNGGIGILCNNGEGNYFEQIVVSSCSIGIVIGHESSTNTVNRMVTSGCYQDFVAGLDTQDVTHNPGILFDPVVAAPWAYGGANGGGWTFVNIKNTSPAGTSAVPAVELIGDGTSNYVGSNNGSFTFINADWSESGVYVPTVRIGSPTNCFIRPTSSPQTIWIIEGQFNTFLNTRVLGAGWVVNSDKNIFDGGQSNGSFNANSAMAITDPLGYDSGIGSYNTFRRVVFSEAATFSGAGNIFEDCQFGNITVHDLGDNPHFTRSEAVSTATYGANVTLDLSLGTHFVVPIANGTGWTLKNPTYFGLSKQITLELQNTSGGAGGTITLESKWKLDGGAIAAPANNTRTVLTCMANGTDLVEVTKRVTGVAL